MKSIGLVWCAGRFEVTTKLLFLICARVGVSLWCPRKRGKAPKVRIIKSQKRGTNERQPP